MQGKNPIRQPVKGSGEILDIKEIFPTLQGEGPNAGMPAVFIRLGGCNLACDFCDTSFEDFISYSLDDILNKTKMLSRNVTDEVTHQLVVITGGEPMRQPIELLCQKLLEEGYQVQVETNGTLFRDLPREVEVVCSPKNQGQGYYPIRADLLDRISAFKFLISAHREEYSEPADMGHDVPTYIQPMDELDEALNAENVRYCVELAQARGYRLSLQLHKLLGIA